MLKIFWKSGTHYYLPNSKNINNDLFIKKLQNPYKNIIVVGESVSKNQGWVNGALQSVENIFC